MTQEIDLNQFDGQHLDGLDFCSKVYDLLDQIRAEPNGASRLRLRPTKLEKKLLEELIPIAKYVQARYRGLDDRFQVCWLDGNQDHDAVLYSSGFWADQGFFPKERVVEVTVSYVTNAHLVRRQLDEQGQSWGARKISQNLTTGEIASEAHAYGTYEREAYLALQTLIDIRKKVAKNYPPGRILIVDCVPDGPVFEREWNWAMERVAEAKAHVGFREVFLLESSRGYTWTLHGDLPSQDHEVSQ
jgi:hypothetical protein